MQTAPEPATLPVGLRISRVFDAPRDLVWLAWTRPEMIVRWLGPVEWPATRVEQDFRVGGAWSAVLKSVDSDRTLWQGGTYREIAPPGRLAFTFRWGERHEDGPPVETLVTIVLTEPAPGRTLMEFTHAALKSAESEAGHRAGWNSSFDRLDTWLITQPHQGNTA